MSKLIPFLASSTGLSEADVLRVIGRAPVSYKFYSIDKRTIGKRLISQPAREVKALQRALIKHLPHLSIHDSATAYRDGRSIKFNAQAHASNGPIKKYDFKDFFHSIRSRDWIEYCKLHEVFADWADTLLSSRLLFHRVPGDWELRLAIGAPSSPWLSNVLMRDFDDRISKRVAEDQVTYTRYADDLTFSARRTGFLTVVDEALRRVIKETEFPKLSLNEEKTKVATTKYRRVVTGLVLANDGRVTIGRDRKRLIRSNLHHAFQGHNSDEDNRKLAGYLAFVNDIEPMFIETIRDKYGPNIIARLSASCEGKIPDEI